MTFKEWKSWVKSLDWSLRWFIILILIRPVVDNFYYIKEISPFLSPLYIVGVASPILAIYAIATIPKPNYVRLDTYMSIMTFLVVMSSVVLSISDSFSLDSIEFLLKYPFAFIMYFFCRRFIRSKKDLHGVFQAFIYSAVIVIVVFTYELIFGAINSQLSRGFERLQGSYADVMNYAIYTTCSLLILFYSFIEKPPAIPSRTRIILLAIALVYTVFILFNIQHTASYAVVAGLSLIFIFHNLRANLGVGIIVIAITAFLFVVIGTESIEERIKPLIETDIKVYEGEKDNDQLLHGRVGRWMNFLDFFNSKSTFIQMIGLPFGMDHPYSFIAKGSHNDFLRTLMFSGYLGLITYLLILINIGFRIAGKSIPITMIGLGALSIMVLYSISTTPLLYPILIYVVMSIFSAIVLPNVTMKNKYDQQ